MEVEEGREISRSGLAKRASTCADCCVVGVRARFLVGRWERRSEEVGMDSGIGSDMLAIQELREVQMVLKRVVGWLIQHDDVTKDM